ncbi:hypothetical protein [Hydromonas duriensis]|uniref:Uncharacterized protein n=1 Tax=Hydromonas duriensis TaxID=1527608 RepID=A0A4R6Y6K8_9BURK|nr:hypothetical protein [Hydromonas duriensis]TDR30681.1 hypothetical protein DFR44_11828 [Hydromonas duriensis]
MAIKSTTKQSFFVIKHFLFCSVFAVSQTVFAAPTLYGCQINDKEAKDDFRQKCLVEKAAFFCDKQFVVDTQAKTVLEKPDFGRRLDAFAHPEQNSDTKWKLTASSDTQIDFARTTSEFYAQDIFDKSYFLASTSPLFPESVINETAQELEKSIGLPANMRHLSKPIEQFLMYRGELRTTLNTNKGTFEERFGYATADGKAISDDMMSEYEGAKCRDLGVCSDSMGEENTPTLGQCTVIPVPEGVSVDDYLKQNAKVDFLRWREENKSRTK